MRGKCIVVAAALLLSFSVVLPIYAAEPRNDSSGRYLSPYTSDGVFAEWVNRTVDARTGEAVGGAVGAAAGAYAGDRLLRNVPGGSFLGGMAGSRAGQATGRQVAIDNAGGEAFMRQSSDLSFDRLEDMAQWMYATHGNGANFPDALKATKAVYPEMEQVYPQAVARVQQERRRAAVAGSIGIMFNMEGGPPVVAEILPDSPAARSEIQVGDTLLRVDGRMLAGLSQQDVSARMRGEVGSPVVVDVVREGDDQIHSYSMTREQLAWPQRQPTQQAQLAGGGATAGSTAGRPAQPAPRKTYTDHNHYGGLSLGFSSGDISGVGFGLAGHGLTSSPERIGWFWDYRLFVSNGDSEDSGVDFIEIAFAVGGSVSVNETIRLYGGVAFDMLDFSSDDSDVDVSGVGLRYGAQFLFPEPNIILRAGMRKVSAEEESTSFSDGAELDYTGLELQLEFGVSDEFGVSLGYEQRDDDSTVYIGIGGRF